VSGKKPKNPLAAVKARVIAGDVVVNPDVVQEAYDDFGWYDPEIRKCLLKLNDRYYYRDRLRNHFYKFEEHWRYPEENTYIDFYRAHKIMDGESVFTHLYVREATTTVIVNSFKELYK
jgi:hypothetical protein